MLKAKIPKDENKLKQQIRALEYQLKQDVTNKDKEIHIMALNTLKSALKEMEGK